MIHIQAVMCGVCRDIYKPLQSEASWMRCAQCSFDVCKDCAAAQRFVITLISCAAAAASDERGRSALETDRERARAERE